MKLLERLVALVFLFLIILIFVFWMHGKKQNQVNDIAQQVETNVNGMQMERCLPILSTERAMCQNGMEKQRMACLCYRILCRRQGIIRFGKIEPMKPGY